MHAAARSDVWPHHDHWTAWLAGGQLSVHTTRAYMRACKLHHARISAGPCCKHFFRHAPVAALTAYLYVHDPGAPGRCTTMSKRDENSPGRTAADAKVPAPLLLDRYPPISTPSAQTTVHACKVHGFWGYAHHNCAWHKRTGLPRPRRHAAGMSVSVGKARMHVYPSSISAQMRWRYILGSRPRNCTWAYAVWNGIMALASVE